MTDVAKLIADMVRAGVDPELIGRAAAALAEREPVLVTDEQAERKRAADRERMRAKREADKDRATSRDSSDELDTVSPKKESSPTPPKEKTTPSSTEPNGSSKTRAARLPADWILPIDWRADAIKAGLPESRITVEAEKMRDWSLSSPNGAKRDWRAAWRNWVKGAAEKLPRGSPGFAKPERPDHFANYSRELSHGQDRSAGSNSRYWDDAQGVPVLTIDYERR